MVTRDAQSDGNNGGNNHVFVTPSDYRIYVILTEHHYSATGGERNVQKALKYKSRGTVSKHIRKLVNLGIIECINPKEKVKFYKAIPNIHVSSSKETTGLLYGGNKIGGAPRKGAVDKIRRREDDSGHFIKSRRKKIPPPTRDFDTVLHKNGKRVKICRTHNISFIGKIVGGPIEDIKWDRKSEPNKRFVQHGRHDHVPSVGNCYFGWNKSDNVSNLRIWLPEKYSLPHELEDPIIDQLGWRAAHWFSKKYHVGIGLLEICSESYAFEATKTQKEFVDHHGTLSIQTAFGKAEIDESKKPWTEQEYSSRAEAKRVAKDLEFPGQLELLERKGDDVKEWIASFQDNFNNFLKLQNQNTIAQEKRWKEQSKFNMHVKKFMEQQDIKNNLFADALSKYQTRLFGTKQTKLDKYVGELSGVSIYG